MRIDMRLSLPAEVKKQGDWYVSRCPILDVYSQGETQKKALENLVEALRLFFVSCFERGTLDAVLKSCGFTAMKTAKPAQAAKGPKYVDVPIPFRTSSKACHV